MNPGKTAFDKTHLTLADIGRAIRCGRMLSRAMPRASLGYATVFTIVGLILLVAIAAVGLSPLALPFAGGFMLVGPILLSGYFELARQHEQGKQPHLSDAFGAFRRAPSGLWAVALICAFLFLIWITDAGILYSFTIGGAQLDYSLMRLHDVVAFELWGSLIGSVLAYLIFCVSAFSVPLIYEGRAGLVQAIFASVRTVLGNFLVCLGWGIVLGSVIMLSILLLPLLLFTLPLMSYASFCLYRIAFPPQQTENTGGREGFDSATDRPTDPESARRR
jgi:uncharacterized membrane protein